MNIGLFYDEQLPFQGTRPDKSLLNELCSRFKLITCGNYEFMLGQEFDCLINLHSPGFIKPAWEYLIDHLSRGKGLVNAGPAIPFSQPFAPGEGCWRKEAVQTAYHEELNIMYGHAVNKDRIERLEPNMDISMLEGFENCFTIQQSTGLVVKFSDSFTAFGGHCNSGPMNASIYPLLNGIGNGDRRFSAPVVLIENTRGRFEGGRWIFINQGLDEAFWAHGGVSLLEKLAVYAARGAYELIIRPNYASYHPGERPVILLQGQSFSGEPKTARIEICIEKDGEMVCSKTVVMDLIAEAVYSQFSVDMTIEKGIYRMISKINIEGEASRTMLNGFCGYDRKLMESGSCLDCGRDYFLKNGNPMPVVGMTYMHSEVHRKYIYLPNAGIWDRDIKELKKAGINMIRTGIWSAHRTVMYNDGIPSEEILRSLDAFFMVAGKYDIHVVFTIFAFTPEMWEGINPYLDPRSIKAQKRFVSSIVSRHAYSTGVSWDLINEPSVSNPGKLWCCATNGDEYERQAWIHWLRERHKTIETLQERWNIRSTEMSSFDSIKLPEAKDFERDVKCTEPQKGLMVHDYMLFSQRIMIMWGQEMLNTIRTLGSRQLVTIGQDEALNGKRPSPLFYQEGMSYTTNHSWWLMDDLYWDGIFCKSPGKPNLIQETGVMYVLNADGKARRSEAELRDILERKYALAFASNNAGAIHWLWNVNVYMNDLNEVNIGALRADGSQRPEADVSYDFGEYMKDVGGLFEDREEEETAVIYPYANDFSIRDYASIAARRLARVLGYNMNIPFKVFGEYHLDMLKTEKLIIIPSPRTLTQCAWETVLDRVYKGSTLLITGPFSSDEYWQYVVSRAGQLGVVTRTHGVSREEVLYIDGKPFRVCYSGDKIGWIDKEVDINGGPPKLTEISLGKGTVVWSPLPIEVNDMDGVIEEIYRVAIKKAGIQSPFKWICSKMTGIFGKRLDFKSCFLYIFVSEQGEDVSAEIIDQTINRTIKFVVPAGRCVLFVLDRSGYLVKSYRGMPIVIR